MKLKILAFLIIICSFASWIIWSFLFFKFLSSDFNIKKDETTKEINTKSIELISLENNITDIVKNTSPSVVSIIIKKDLLIYKSDPWWFFRKPVWTVREKIWWWSWFFITKDGYIITNKHVVSDKEAIYTVITNDSKEYDAVVLATDPTSDLAIIKIDLKEKESKALEFIDDNSQINIWEFAIAIWNALWELQNSVSLWVVSWKNRTIKDSWIDLYWLIQTDAAINPWNSWWPLLNLDWKVIWINTAIINNSEWIWFSIVLTQKKIDYMMNSIKKYGLIKKPFIWISYIIINQEIKEKYKLKTDFWAYIPENENAIIEWSNAKKSWLKAWDIILKIDSKEINKLNTISDIISSKIPWDIIDLEVLWKSWEIRDIKLELWEA